MYMKNTRSICSLLLVVTTISTLCAQSQADSTKFKPYWELNIDLLPVIKQNIVPVMSVGFRRPFQQRNGLIKAFRGRIGIDYLYDYDHAPELGRNYDYKLNLNTYLSLGLDWQRNFQKWEYYYGVELINSLNYQKNKDVKFDIAPFDKDATFVNYSNAYTYKVCVAGVVGVRRKIADRLLLGVESSLQAGFDRQYVYGEGYSTVNGKITVSSKGNGDYLRGTMNLRPIYTLNLIYQLKKRSKNEKNTVFNNNYR